MSVKLSISSTPALLPTGTEDTVVG